MRNVKRYLGVFISAVVLLTGCNAPLEEVEETETEANKLRVVTTLFPQYDFVRQIAGNKVEVSKLLPPGVDVHSYEPTPADIISLNEADLFIYTGAEMEPWAHRLIESVDEDINVLDVSINVPLIPWGDASHTHVHEEEDHEHNHEEEGHDHNHEEEGHEHNHDEENHDHNHDEECDHDHVYDPHIWTSPINAMIMVNNILEMLIELDPENETYYRENAEAYLLELEILDSDFREVVENAERNTIFHAGRFAVHYLMYEYGINYVAAPLETEPSVALVAQMITEIREENIPAIFHEELVTPRIAQMISEETGAKMLLLHSVHNVSNEELTNGVTYLDLMNQNVENLRLGLN